MAVEVAVSMINHRLQSVLAVAVFSVDLVAVGLLCCLLLGFFVDYVVNCFCLLLGFLLFRLLLVLSSVVFFCLTKTIKMTFSLTHQTPQRQGWCGGEKEA